MTQFVIGVWICAVFYGLFVLITGADADLFGIQHWNAERYGWCK